MKFRILLLIVHLTIQYQNLFAQTATHSILYTGPFPSTRGSNFVQLSQNTVAIFTRNDKNESQSVSIINDTLEEVLKFDINEDHFDKDRPDIMYGGTNYAREPDLYYNETNNELLYFQILIEKGKKKCIGNRYDINTGKLISSKILWDDISKKEYPSPRFSKRGNYILVYIMEDKELKLKIFDNLFNEKSSFEVEQDKKLDFVNSYIADTGDAFFAFIPDKDGNSFINIFSQNKIKNVWNLPIRIDTEWGYRNIKFDENDYNTKIVANTEPTKQSLFGVYVAEYNVASSKVIKQSTISITKDEYILSLNSIDPAYINSSHSDSKSTNGLEFIINEVVYDENGTFIVLEDLRSSFSSYSVYTVKNTFIIGLDTNCSKKWTSAVIKHNYRTAKGPTTMPDFTIVQSIVWKGTNSLNIISPDLRKDEQSRSIFYRTVDLNTGKISSPKDVFVNKEASMYHTSSLFVPFSENKILLHCAERKKIAGIEASGLVIFTF